jgi:UDP-3-O-[3-hydroxymyristoyl] glucosamine N-acyltransferase
MQNWEPMNSFCFDKIAQITNAILELSLPHCDVPLQKCATLAFATESDISFCMDNAACGAARTTKAAVVFVPENFTGWAGEAKALARVKSPYGAIIKCAEILNKNNFAKQEIHPSAQISPHALVLGSVGANSVIGAFCSVLEGVKIGENCILHPGASIGSRGFGFYTGENGEQIAVPHFGGVVIGDNCEIGPNSVVAAGFLEATRLGNFCKLDSFVQIGHNCIVGNNVVFCSQSGLAGSVIVEDNVTLAGGAQVAGHLILGKGCIIAAKAGVTKSIKPGAKVAGFPAIPIGEWRRKFC